MRVLVWIVVLFTLAVGFTLAGKYDPGYAVLVYPPYRIELSLTLLVVLFLGLLTMGHLFLQLASATLRLPERVNAFRALQREQKSRTALSEALTELFETRYRRAEKSAAQALALNPAAWQAALIAARAAHKTKAYSRRDAYLEQVRRLAPDQALARLVTEAICFLEQGLPAEALDRLHQAMALDPRHEGLLKLELRVQQLLKNWDRTLELADLLGERQLLEPGTVEHLRGMAQLENIRIAANSLAALHARWEKIPSTEKTRPSLAIEAAMAFAVLDETAIACSIIEHSLTQQWDATLVRAYGEIQGEETQRQFAHAEKWLAGHPEDAALLLLLGKLCLRQSLADRAEIFFRASLTAAPTWEASFGLGQVLEQAGQTEAACLHYRIGSDLLRKNNPGGAL